LRCITVVAAAGAFRIQAYIIGIEVPKAEASSCNQTALCPWWLLTLQVREATIMQLF
jgi:hypothetical protein